MALCVKVWTATHCIAQYRVRVTMTTFIGQMCCNKSEPTCCCESVSCLTERNNNKVMPPLEGDRVTAGALKFTRNFDSSLLDNTHP